MPSDPYSSEAENEDLKRHALDRQGVRNTYDFKLGKIGTDGTVEYSAKHHIALPEATEVIGIAEQPDAAIEQSAGEP